jgi:hypothetical protein
LVDEEEGRPPVKVGAASQHASGRPKLGVRWVAPAQ